VGTLPSRDQTNADAPGKATYQGVALVAGKFTWCACSPASRKLVRPTRSPALRQQLELFDSNGHRISTLQADSSPASLTTSTCGLCVSLADRANPGASFYFLIPWQQTYHQQITFRATVTPPIGPGLRGQCAGCRGNIFTLDAVPFTSTAVVPIHPIPLTVGGARSQKNESQVFADAQTVLPEQLHRRPLTVRATLSDAPDRGTKRFRLLPPRERHRDLPILFVVGAPNEVGEGFDIRSVHWSRDARKQAR
jgi:hypothetical protein